MTRQSAKSPRAEKAKYLAELGIDDWIRHLCHVEEMFSILDIQVSIGDTPAQVANQEFSKKVLFFFFYFFDSANGPSISGVENCS